MTEQFQKPGSIAMFHAARSGSTVLGDLANQHPHIFWDGEIYSPDRRATKLIRRLIPDPIQFLRLRMKLAGNRWYGFEIQLADLERLDIGCENFVEMLKRLGYNRFILLERKNYLRIIVSALIALENAKWHQRNAKRAMLTKIRLNIDHVFEPDGLSLIGALQYITQWFQSLNRLLSDQALLALVYEEDISDDPLVAYRRVCHFLDLEPQAVAVRYSKTNPFKLEAMVENFDQVVDVLHTTGFEWMLYG